MNGDAAVRRIGLNGSARSTSRWRFTTLSVPEGGRFTVEYYWRNHFSHGLAESKTQNCPWSICQGAALAAFYSFPGSKPRRGKRIHSARMGFLLPLRLGAPHNDRAAQSQTLVFRTIPCDLYCDLYIMAVSREFQRRIPASECFALRRR